MSVYYIYVLLHACVRVCVLCVLLEHATRVVQAGACVVCVCATIEWRVRVHVCVCVCVCVCV